MPVLHYDAAGNSPSVDTRVPSNDEIHTQVPSIDENFPSETTPAASSDPWANAWADIAYEQTEPCPGAPKTVLNIVSKIFHVLFELFCSSQKIQVQKHGKLFE